MEKRMKVILITGASSGIGYDAARALSEQGHRVYAAARRLERMEPLKEYGVVPLRMDVTDEASMGAGVRAVLEAEGRVDVLINNAGYGFFGAIENVPMEEARRQQEVNVFGLARLCQLVLPTMRAQKSGRIINVASVAGKAVLQYGGWYHVSKFSVEALSDSLRMELKPFGIDVVIIEPGAIGTEWGDIAADHLSESSRGTVYEEGADNMAALMHFAYSQPWLSKPSVVTRAILKAVNRRHPKARYRIGRGAHLMVGAHALMPTRWWDGMNRIFLKLKLKGVTDKKSA